MTELARVVEDVAAPAEALWALIADFGAPQRFAATIERCEVTGTGVGAVRVVHARGLTIHERLVESDPRARRLRYEILPSGDMPILGLSRYSATVVLEPLSDTVTRVNWSSEGLVSAPLAPITENFNRLYKAAIATLAILAAAPRSAGP